MEKTNSEKIYNLLYKNFTNKDKLSGILHKDGYLYVSNGHILAKIKFTYTEDKEGKSFDKDGNIVNPPNYENVITKSEKYQQKLNDNIVSDLKIAAKKLNKISRKNQYFIIDIELPLVFYNNKECTISYNSVYLNSIFKLFDLLKEPFEVYTMSNNDTYNHRLIFKSLNSDTVVELMAMMIESDYYYYKENILTIKEAIEIETIDDIYNNFDKRIMKKLKENA